MHYCLNCGKELKDSKRHNKYCDISCQKQYAQKVYIERWKAGEETGRVGEYGISRYIKNYLFEKNNNKCELCGWGEINSFTGLIPLEVHHIDGDHKNTSESNLQLLCPNCHALTNNFKSRGNGTRVGRIKYDYNSTCIDCGKPITTHSIRCAECEKKRRIQQGINDLPISKEDLKNRIRTETFSSIAKDFNMSANGIKRWMTKYGLPNTKKEINTYSDEEWDKL